jgi:hypothetical protein
VIALDEHRSQQAPRLPMAELRRVAAKRVEHARSEQAGERPEQCRGERDRRALITDE